MTRFAQYALTACYFVMGAGAMSVIGLNLPMSDGLGVSGSAIAFLVSVYAFVYGIAAPGLQTLIGNLDRRNLIIWGLGAIGFGSLLGAFSPNYEIMLVSRVMMAGGGALVGPLASALAAALVPVERRGAALAAVFGGLTLATVLGVPLSAYLGTVMSWRGVLALIAGCAALIILWVLRVVPHGSRGQRTTLRTLFATVTDTVVGPAVLVTFFQVAAQFAVYALTAIYLTTVFAMSEAMVPIALLLFGAGGVVGNMLAPVLARRFGDVRTMLCSLFVLAAAFVGLLVAPQNEFVAFALLIVWAVAALVMMSPQQARLMALAPDAGNLVLALNASALYLGMALGAAIAGVASTKFGLASLPIFSLILMVFAVLSLLISMRQKPAPAV